MDDTCDGQQWRRRISERRSGWLFFSGDRARILWRQDPLRRCELDVVLLEWLWLGERAESEHPITGQFSANFTI